MRIRSLITALSALLLLLGGAAAQAQDTSAQEARKARLEKEMAVLNQQLSDNSAKSRSALSQLQLVSKKVNIGKSMVAQTEKEIRVCNDRIYAKQRQINELQRRVDTLSAYYSRLVRAAYKNRDAKIWYMYMIASDNLGQAFRRYSYFKNLSDNMKDQATKLRQTQAELEEEKLELEKLKAESQVVKAQREKELQSLQKDEAQSQKLVSDLKKSRSKYEKELAAKKKQVEQLNREIQKIISNAMGGATTSKGAKTGKKTSTEVDATLSKEFSRNKGKLPWPVNGSVVGRFGQHNHPVFTNVQLPFNNGVDIATSKGSQVNAVFDGVVKQIVLLPGYNQCILVQHGNYFTLYCKMKTVSVKAGTKVKTGQSLGTIDTINGESQIHFELWQNQTPQNPELWLQ